MNLRRILNQVGVLLVVIGVLAAVVAGYASFASTSDATIALLIGAGLSALPGATVFLLTREGDWHVERREAILLMPVSWIVASIAGCVPYVAWSMLVEGPTPFVSVFDALFESTSAFTTTGASVIDDVDAIPSALLLWRAICAWVGGLATVVLFAAVLPTLGVGRHSHADATSDTHVHEHIGATARLLLRVYGVLTVAAMLTFLAAGEAPFDAACHGLSIVATCAFRTTSESPGPLVVLASIVYLFLGSVSFVVLLRVAKRRWRAAIEDPELRVQGAIAGIGLVLATIMILIVGRYGFLEGMFASVEAHTTARLETRVSVPVAALLFLLAFVGGASGSTAGGVKVFRFWLCLRVFWNEIERAYRPHVVRPLRVGGSTVTGDAQLAAVTYVLGIIFLWSLVSTVIRLVEPSIQFETVAIAALGAVGSWGAPLDYGEFGVVSKLLLMLLMIVGRLEILAMLALLSPRFWSHH